MTRTRPESAADAFILSPFSRLARTHAVSTAADAMVATALAGTIFFAGATSEARGKVFLYLVLTMAPFAVMSPLIGPALDRARGGRRWMIIGSALLRAFLCFLMIGDVDSILLFPEAFAVLVLQKAYQVARSAIVPSTVRTDAELVEANSKLSLLSGIASFVGAAPAALLYRFGGAEWALGGAMVTFIVTALFGLKLPKESVARQPVDAAERAELRSVGVLLAASAMGLLRGIVGFLTLLLAFDFRGDDVPGWHFAVVVAVSVVGSLVGAAAAPRVRRSWTEERMLTAVLVLTVAAAVAAMALGGVQGAAVLAAVVGIAATAGKLAFDSIVQRDAPDANRGRSFARFETRFQVIWVIGAMIGLITMPVTVGFLIVALTAGFAAFSYGIGSLAWRHRSGTQVTPATQRAAVIDTRINGMQLAARQGFARSAGALRRRLPGGGAERDRRRAARDRTESS